PQVTVIIIQRLSKLSFGFDGLCCLVVNLAQAAMEIGVFWLPNQRFSKIPLCIFKLLVHLSLRSLTCIFLRGPFDPPANGRKPIRQHPNYPNEKASQFF